MWLWRNVRYTRRDSDGRRARPCILGRTDWRNPIYVVLAYFAGTITIASPYIILHAALAGERFRGTRGRSQHERRGNFHRRDRGAK